MAKVMLRAKINQVHCFKVLYKCVLRGSRLENIVRLSEEEKKGNDSCLSILSIARKREDKSTHPGLCQEDQVMFRQGVGSVDWAVRYLRLLCCEDRTRNE